MKILYKLNIFVLVISLVFFHALHSFLRGYVIYCYLMFSNVLDWTLSFMSGLWSWSLVWNGFSLLAVWHLVFKTLVSCGGWDVVVRGLDSTELLEGLPWKMLVGCVGWLWGKYLQRCLGDWTCWVYDGNVGGQGFFLGRWLSFGVVLSAVSIANILQLSQFILSVFGCLIQYFFS